MAERFSAAGLHCDDVIWPGVPDLGLAELEHRDPTVAFAGRLVPEKGLDVLLRAMARLGPAGRPERIRLLIAGSGPSEAGLRALASALGLRARVEWLGQLSPEQAHRRLAGAWLHVMPSVWDEPFGVTALEAMMRGTPVIAPDRSGVAELLGDSNGGLVVRAGDVAALAEAMHTILGDRAAWSAAARTARSCAQEHGSIERCTSELLATYRSVVRPDLAADRILL